MIIFPLKGYEEGLFLVIIDSVRYLNSDSGEISIELS